MNEYTVTWAIDIDADTPEEAAKEAMAIQRDPDSIATVFMVSDGKTTTKVDLECP